MKMLLFAHPRSKLAWWVFLFLWIVLCTEQLKYQIEKKNSPVVFHGKNYNTQVWENHEDK